MIKNPLVTVIMPIYNGSRFMEKAIESILRQTYQHFELFIIDNGSTDNTYNILKKYKKIAPNKIKIYRLRKNIGAFAAANYVFRYSKGTYIAPMDCDDISHVKRLEKEVAELEKNPRTLLIGSYAKIINSSGRITGAKHYPTHHEQIYKAFAKINPIVHPSMMIRRSLLPKRNFLYHTNYGVNSDYYTFFEWMNYGTFANIPEYLLRYRIHGGNSSLQNLKERFWNITTIRFAAISKLRYQAPVVMFPIIAMQALLVSMLPEFILRETFFYLRGLKKFHINIPSLSLKKNIATIKQYALSSR